jgi:hypothetical protein
MLATSDTGVTVPGRNTIGMQAGTPSALHISKRRETNHNQDCITKSSRTINIHASCTRWVTTTVTQQWLYEVSKYYKHRSLTWHSPINGSKVMLLDIARTNGLGSLEHNGDVLFHRFQAATWEPQATRQCRCPYRTHLWWSTYFAAKSSKLSTRT